MAPGACFYCSPGQNPFTILADDDSINALPGASTKSSSSFTPIFRTPSPISDLSPAPVAPSADENLFKLFMRAYLAARTTALTAAPGLASSPDAGPRQRPLKARFSELYYRNSYMDCYRFCQQCKDHFDMAGATGTNRIPFAALFLQDTISHRWVQYKTRLESTNPITWPKFKQFLQKKLGDTKTFVDGL